MNACSLAPAVEPMQRDFALPAVCLGPGRANISWSMYIKLFQKTCMPGKYAKSSSARRSKPSPPAWICMHACMHVWFDYEVFRPRLMQLCLTASQETLPCFICMMTILTCISEASWMIYACMHEFVGLAVASHYGIHTVDVVLLKVMVFFTFTPLTSAWPGKIAI